MTTQVAEHAVVYPEIRGFRTPERHFIGRMGESDGRVRRWHRVEITDNGYRDVVWGEATYQGHPQGTPLIEREQVNWRTEGF
jgi:hypothetical protein